jgi:peptidoglycan/LPS O-acetylase OafA/YrhL
MLPLIMHLRIRRPGRRGFGFYFPVFIVWIILAALLIAVFPFMLLAAFLTWGDYPGPRLLLIYPMLAAVLWNLSGLHIETKDAENDILIAF